jgi:adenylate cyclase
MAADDRATIAALDDARAIFRKEIEGHDGRVVDMAGDSVLAVFGTSAGAVKAALTIQGELRAKTAALAPERRMLFRIGVHVGDVFEKPDGTVYGDGVNIAARLQGLAQPGGVTVSDAVRGAVREKVGATFEDQGEQKVKNIEDPVRAFRLRARDEVPAPPPAARVGTKPSVLLMPLEPGGTGDEERTLAAAATDEIVASLARLTGLALVTSTEAADYVAKGRIRNAGGRVRATLQLHDRRAAKQFWSDHFDTGLGDVFAALDELALRISNALRYEIYARETEIAASRSPETLTDEERMGQAGHILLGSKRSDWERSRRLIEPVIAKSPENFMALGIRAVNAMIEPICGWREPTAQDTAEGLRLAQRALELNERSDFAHIVLGMIQLLCERDTAAAKREARRALELNPNYTLAMDLLGAATIFSGDAAAGLPHCERAAKANPRFPANGWFMQHVALGRFVLREHEAALESAQLADERERNVPRHLLVLVSTAWHAGRHELARSQARRLLGLCPDLNLRELRRWPFDDAAEWQRLLSGLDASGLPG